MFFKCSPDVSTDPAPMTGQAARRAPGLGCTVWRYSLTCTPCRATLAGSNWRRKVSYRYVTYLYLVYFQMNLSGRPWSFWQALIRVVLWRIGRQVKELDPALMEFQVL